MFIYIVLTIVCFEYVRRKYYKLGSTQQGKTEFVRSQKILVFKAGLICGLLWVLAILKFLISMNEKLIDVYEHAELLKHPITLVCEILLFYIIFAMVSKKLITQYIYFLQKPSRVPSIPTDADKIDHIKKSVIQGIAEWGAAEYAISRDVARKELESMLGDNTAPVQAFLSNKIGMIEYALEKINSSELLMNIYLIIIKDNNPLKITLKTKKMFTWDSLPQNVREEFIRSGKGDLIYRLYPGGAKD